VTPPDTGPAISKSNADWTGTIALLLLAFAFFIAFRTEPMFFDNQNTKFLHGMAAAHVGHLANDWTANTKDGLILFSALIYALFATHTQLLIYVFHAAVFIGFALWSQGIARTALADSKTTPIRALAPFDQFAFVFVAILIVMNVGGWASHLWSGVAKQYILGRDFEPQSFGVFFLGALFFYLTGRKNLGLACAAIPALVHPGLIVPSAVLTVSLLYAERRQLPAMPWMTWAMYALVFGLLVGHSLYLKSAFPPTAPAIWAQSNYILTQVRIPDHSDVGKWLLNPDGMEKVVTVIIALFLSRGRTQRAYDILILSFAFWIVVSIIAALTGNNFIAFIAPWRASVWIVPLAMAVVVGWIAEKLTARLPALNWNDIRLSPVWLVIAALTLSCLLYGAADKTMRYTKPDPEYARYLRAAANDKTLILQPTGLYALRLQVLAPVYVTFKTNPYRDIDTLEWYRRVKAADAIYAKQTIDCAALADLTRREHFTHIVLTDKTQMLSCPFAQLKFQDEAARVYTIEIPAKTAS